MSEMKAYRIVHDDTGMVEYRIEVRVAHFADENMPPVPGEYLAGYMANVLREFVNSSTLLDEVKTVMARDFPKRVCPTCLREV